MSKFLKALLNSIMPTAVAKEAIAATASPPPKPREENFYVQQRTEPHALYPAVEEASAQVNLYRLEDQIWRLKVSNAKITIYKINSETPKYQVEIRNSDQKILIQFFLSAYITYSFKPIKHCLTWNLTLPFNDQAFQVEFLDTKSELGIADLWNRGVFETTRQEDCKTAIKSQSDRDWIHYASINADKQTDLPIWNAQWSWKTSTQIEYPKAKQANAHMIENLLYNQVYINQGDMMTVLQYDSINPTAKYRCRYPIVSEYDHLLCPTQILLTDESKKMLILSDSKKTRVTQVDLGTGKVIQEFGVNPDWHIKELAPMTKLGAMDGTQEVLAVNNNSLFSMDPRQQGSDKLAQVLSYPSAPGFSCLASDQSGHIVTGTRSGQIRLYSDVTKKAKTLLPGLGDGITGLDITEDGLWILATTPHYLLLIPTTSKAAKISGFETSISQCAQPPIKLQFSPEDRIRLKIKEVNFTKATFNLGSENGEELILTSTGPHLITWNFNHIKAGRDRYQYQIKSHDRKVVANQFRYQHQNQIMVALDQAVYIEHS
jgi:hypothetical protein